MYFLGGFFVDFLNKKVLVCGMARSGISASLLLKSKGAYVTLQDIKTEDKFEEEIKILKENNINLYLGKNPDEIIKTYDFVVMSPGIPLSLPFLEIAKKNNIPILGEIELAYNFCEGNVIAITGTNGKTTTTALTGEIIKNYIPNSKIVGNIGLPFSENVLELKKEDYAILEASSFQLESIHKFHANISAVLNITPDHLDRHITMENYVQIKERVFLNQTSEDFLILNYDDVYCKAMAEKTKSKVIFFSSTQVLEEGIYLKNDSIYANILRVNEKIIDVLDLNILGTHNVENAMAAIAISICANIKLDIIKKILHEFKGVEHRIEYVTTINNIEFYNDSKGTNTDAAIKSINAMRRPIVLIGGGYEKKADFTDWVKMFANKVKYLVVIGEVSDRLIETCKENNFFDFYKANTFEEAIQVAFENAIDGDCVLLSPACASFGMFKNFEHRGELFKKYVSNIK